MLLPPSSLILIVDGHDVGEGQGWRPTGAGFGQTAHVQHLGQDFGLQVLCTGVGGQAGTGNGSWRTRNERGGEGKKKQVKAEQR